MAWPQATDYNAAIQNPQVCFSDPDLRQGQAAGDLFGLPRPHSGNFADVYQMQCPGNQAWAVKCFTREVGGRQQRYQAISDHLRHAQRAFMVDFHYLEQGIRIHGQWYPILKMRWVEGFTLNQFVADHLDKPALLDRLAQLWLKLAQELREARMAHGDLQHGNVLLIPGSKSSSLALRLIDYDGMFVPSLANQPSGEVGHPNYQHPQRLRDGLYDVEVDRFAHLVIYTALRCLAVGGLPLWLKYDNLENLLFREADFRSMGDSKLLRELWALTDAEARALVGHLVLATLGPAQLVPLLDQVVPGGTVRPLTALEEQMVCTLLKISTDGPRRTRLGPPPVPGMPSPVVAGASDAAVPAVALLAPVEASVATAPFAPVPVNGPIKTSPNSVPVPGLPPLPSRAEVIFAESPEKKTEDIIDVPFLGAATPGPAVVMRPAVHPPGQALWPVLRDFVKARPWVLAVAGGSLLFLTAGILLITQMAATPGPPPQARDPVIVMLNPELVFRGGESGTLDLVINRNDCTDPLVVQTDGLPGQVTATKPEVDPSTDTAQVRLTAELRAECLRRPVTVSVWAGGRKVADQTVKLTVAKRLLPRLLAPNPVILKRGEERTLTFRIDRHGCTEALHLKLLELPANVVQQSTEVAGQRDTLPLNLRAASDAPATTKLVQLGLFLGPHPIQQELVAITVEKLVQSVRLRDHPSVLTLTAGKTREFQISVDRVNYEGPIHLRLDALPAGVKCPEATIPADSRSARLEIQADDNVVLDDKTITVRARSDEGILAEETFVLSVKKPETTVRPPDKPPVKLPAAEEVEIATLDAMMLNGKFYPGTKGKNSPCAIVLHDLGVTRPLDGYHDLAQALQKQGLAVLLFEFRGHGGSRTVPGLFWTFAENRPLLKKGIKGQETINYREFPAAYQTYLANDIAAARRYLDQRNDQEEVNSSNLIVIGSGKAATLGALWLATECHRVEAPGGVLNLKNAEPEGKNVLGTVWLSIDPTVGNKVVSIPNLLQVTNKTNKIPTLFVYGKDDTTGSARARAYAPADKPGGEGMHLLQAHAVPETNVTGQHLLAKDAGGEAVVVKYVADLLAQQPLAAWGERDFGGKGYLWNIPGNASVAKTVNQIYLQRLPIERILR